jgi:hypothetical protein
VQPSVQNVERRQLERGAPAFEPARAHLVSLILGTYGEMPGLMLYLKQAARLFGVREMTCRVVMEELVRRGRLRQSTDGQYLLGT